VFYAQGANQRAHRNPTDCPIAATASPQKKSDQAPVSESPRKAPSHYDSHLFQCHPHPVFSTIAIFSLLAAQSSLIAQQHHHHDAETGDPNATIEKFGAVSMPISCAADVQIPFERGIALMHSFWYEEAVKQFKAVAIADPQCAMAQWGLAMTEWRPFWDGMPDSRRKAGIAEIDKAAALNASTDRERRYIAALSGYMHADPAHNAAALHAYDDAMASLHPAYPDDVEATAFYGLALAASIGTQDPVGDARKTLAILEPGFAAYPDHPGFAHYIIHTCDSPQLAQRYAAIAPSSAHALHMPGHIFARLGMWQQDIDSNEASVRASEDAIKNHQSGATHELHAYEFLLWGDEFIESPWEIEHIGDSFIPSCRHFAKAS
jgi:hypothetical protein